MIGTTVAAALAYLPWWSVAVPAGLTVAYLVLCRTQVRRGVQAVRVRPAVAEPAVALDAAPDLPAQVDERSDVPFDAESVGQSASESVVEPLAVDDATGSIWDPLPVTLPTYVTAPKAQHRTVRTIDLGEPGTWTSGRTAEDAEIAVQAAQPEAPDDAGRRAVGS